MGLVRVVEGWLSEFRCIFSRRSTFHWFVLLAWAFLLRLDGAGVTSVIRCLGLAPLEYYNALHFFHSTAFTVEQLCRRWAEVLSRRAPLLTLQGKPVYVVDAVVAAKAGKRMPAVKALHQDSENNNKPEFVMGHFWGALTVLARAGQRLFALPVRFALQDGLKRSPSDSQTTITRMYGLVTQTALVRGTVVADCYYTCRVILHALRAAGFHYIGRVRHNTVAYVPVEQPSTPRRGRPKKYGNKVILQQLFADRRLFHSAAVDLYGKVQQVLLHEVELYWQGLLVKFVLTINSEGKRAIFLSTDRSLSPETITGAYGWRFKIEVGFRALIEVVFGFCYRFWMKAMPKLKRGDGTQHLHRATPEYRAQVKRKVEAYERFVNLAGITLGILQLVALTCTETIWAQLPLWFRTLRKEAGPSEDIVRATLQAEMASISNTSAPTTLLGKILATLDRSTMPSGHPMQLVA